MFKRTAILPLFVAAILLMTTTLMSPVLAQQNQLDNETKASVVEGVCEALIDRYVFPDVADEMAAYLRSQLAEGAYDAIADPLTFANTLTSDLHEINNDLHLRVRYYGGAPDVSAEPDPDAEAQANNFGFVKVETLSDNIGYLDFRMFGEVSPESERTVAGAMGFLSNTDAIIIDLRRNHGGTPDMVAFIISYLYDETPVHLNTIYNRAEDSYTDYYTLEDVPMPDARMPDKPVFVLTSSSTFSGAEEFTYNLQAMGRATIVGEVTGGGAHPTVTMPLVEPFAISVPFARSINPITNTNWEGVGVIPDVEVAAEDALDVAHDLAREAVLAAVGIDAQQWEAENQVAFENPPALDEAILQRYAGTYNAPDTDETGTFLIVDGGLVLELSGQTMPLYPINETVFAVDREIRIEFMVEDDGSVMEGALFMIDGTRIPFYRVEEE